MDAREMRGGLGYTMTPQGGLMDVTERGRMVRAQLLGKKTNLCPFGCQDHHLNEHGICRHLVGYTVDGKTYEPLVRKKGRYIVQVPRTSVPLPKIHPDDEQEFEDGPPQVKDVEATDTIRWIGSQGRVYRPAPGEKPIAAPEPAPVWTPGQLAAIDKIVQAALERVTAPAAITEEA